MYKPGKCSERSRLEPREAWDAADECGDHIKAGLSHRQNINEDVAMRRLIGIPPKEKVKL